MTVSQPATLDISTFSIMLAEDYEFIQYITTGILRRLGVNDITVCEDGQEAKEKIQILGASKSSDSKMPDIILTDWMMPEMDGEKLLTWIRGHENEKIKFAPVVVVSAFTDKETIIAARDAGANEVLVKPVSGTKLANRILNIINHPRPFIKSSDFFGPDRRRKDQKFKGDEKRVANAEEVKVNHEKTE